MQITEIPAELEPQFQQRSTLATVSLICSFIICCPIVTIFGPLLGLIALVKLKRNPALKGKGFAWTGIIVGTISTIISVLLIVVVVTFGFTVIDRMAMAAQTTIQAGYDGDYETFRDSMSSMNSPVTDEEIQEFIEELRTRYGTFDSVVFDMEPDTQTLQQTGGDAAMPMHLVFEETDVSAEILLRPIPNNSSPLDLTFQLNCILIIDPVNGDLAFPAGSYCDISGGVTEKAVGEELVE